MVDLYPLQSLNYYRLNTDNFLSLLDFENVCCFSGLSGSCCSYIDPKCCHWLRHMMTFIQSKYGSRCTPPSIPADCLPVYSKLVIKKTNCNKIIVCVINECVNLPSPNIYILIVNTVVLHYGCWKCCWRMQQTTPGQRSACSNFKENFKCSWRYVRKNGIGWTTGKT